MRWHKKNHTNDRVLRHPVDAEEWKEFDNLHESFAQDPQNVRLMLATYGFNPFSNMSSSYNTWPVILLPYNLPPWKLESSFFHTINAYSGYLFKLKQYVTNNAFLEESMAEGYIAEECLTFCSMYLSDIQTQFNKVERNYEKWSGKSQQGLFVLSKYTRLIEKGEHKEELRQNSYSNSEKKYEEYFAKWFENRCDWYEGKSVEIDKYDCTSINISKPWKTNESYVLASQGQQIFYVDDIKLGKNWKVVIELQAQSSWNVLENKDDDGCPVTYNESYMQNAPHNSRIHMDSFSNFVEWNRNDIPTTTVNSNGMIAVEDYVDALIEDQHEQEEEEDYTLAKYGDEEKYCVDENKDHFEVD
ncbi:UNVERIFIED_CONTAM: hypothetical protein Sradi_5743500 [Sesamum radiatum]|uniref:DUF4216 domain-containing protein n=1 Tax=Sesamum radiatum TaxID=300843 RepID=A0AAW2L2F9_SESRA